MKPLDLTPAQIAPAFPGAKLANIEQYWPYVRDALQADQLIGGRIVAYALGTIAAESAGFEPISECPSKWNTIHAPFDRYEHRGALGNVQPGDGARFKGRGFVQLTGRANYRRYGERIGVDLEADPSQANDPRYAAQLLSLFICDRESRILAALGEQDYAKARKLVNGGSHGMDRFRAACAAILACLAKGGV